MEQLIEMLGSNGSTAALIVLAIIAGAAVIAPAFPAPKEKSSTAYRIFYRLINVIAQNYGKAKNKDDN